LGLGMNVVEKRSLKLGLGAGLSALGVALTWFCCLPLALGGFGLGAAALGAAMAPLRPWFSGAALVLLGGAFYYRYRRPACRPAEACAVAPNRIQQFVLWTIAVVTLAMLTVDRWASSVIYWFL
jgi:hypothetical protein